MRAARGFLLSLSLALLFSLSCCGLTPLAAQSSEASPPPLAFVDGKTYQVTGAQLNRLQADLLTAKRELNTSTLLNTQLTTENAQLQSQIKALSEQLAKESADRLADSQAKLKALAELQTQLTTASASLTKLQGEADTWRALAGGAGAVALVASIWALLK